MENFAVLLLALAADALLGEPPAALHPVVGMGKTIAFLERRAPQRGPAAQRAYGILMVGLTAGLFTMGAWLVLHRLRAANAAAHLLASVFLLKATFAVRELSAAALRIRLLLEEGRLAAARGELKALVSRDTSRLDEPLVVAAAVESVAENTNDSFVAPLCYYFLFGVPGAVAYRAVNTCDAMVGYRGRHEHLGKATAWLDDLLNFIPARLTGLLLVAAAGLCRRDAQNGWRLMRRDHALTASPNAGWPVSAAAGALGVRLEKVGHYRLGDARHPLSPAHIPQAVGLMRGAVALAVLLYGVAEAVRYAYRS